MKDFKEISLETTYKWTFLCPECSNKSFSCGHLLVGTKFGAWYCDHCGSGWFGCRVSERRVELQRSTSVKINTWDVLHLYNNPEIKIIVDGMSFQEVGKPVDVSGKDYFYREHTCPWNYLRFNIRDGDDTDPHGIFLWERSYRAPKDFDEFVSGDRWDYIELGTVELLGVSDELEETEV